MAVALMMEYGWLCISRSAYLCLAWPSQPATNTSRASGIPRRYAGHVPELGARLTKEDRMAQGESFIVRHFYGIWTLMALAGGLVIGIGIGRGM